MDLLKNLVAPDHHHLEEKVADVTRELPADLISEILTWVPSDSLHLSCKWVCKDWHSLITSDQSFLKLHQLRTPTINGFFIQTNTANTHHDIFIRHSPSSSIINPSPALDFLPCNPLFDILASSKSGLLCCATSNDTCFYMCKPCTKQWRQIPSPTTNFRTVMMMLMVVSTMPYLQYKLVRFSLSVARIRGDRERIRADRYKSYCCEIFDSNNDQWKRLEDVRLPILTILSRGQSVLINQIFHLLPWENNTENNIFAFDMDEERWRLFQVPQEIIEVSGGGRGKRLVNFDGKLGLIHYIRGEFLDIWVLADYMNEKWEKKCRVRLDQDGNEFSCILREYYPLDLYKDGILLMMSYNYDQVIWFDYQRNSCEVVKMPPADGLLVTSPQAFPFESDMVPI